jgi:hypothetical protein
VRGIRVVGFVVWAGWWIQSKSEAEMEITPCLKFIRRDRECNLLLLGSVSANPLLIGKQVNPAEWAVVFFCARLSVSSAYGKFGGSSVLLRFRERNGRG